MWKRGRCMGKRCRRKPAKSYCVILPAMESTLATVRRRFKRHGIDVSETHLRNPGRVCWRPLRGSKTKFRKAVRED